MKIASFHDINDIRYENVNKPVIGEGEILVKVRVCGLCGTDVSKIRGKTVAVPAVLGHEVAGDIAEVGEGIEGVKVGERVVVSHHVPCFTCRYCRHGSYSQCESFKKTNIVPGGFSEYMRVLPRSVEKSTFRIPDSLSYEQAAFTETVACCLRAVNKCEIRRGDTVMIIGAGPVGLLHLQLALLSGASNVIVSDLVDFRLDFALKLGADKVVNPSRDSTEKIAKEVNRADIVIVAVGNTDALEESLNFVSGGGRVMFFAESPEGSLLKLDPNFIYHSEVTILGSYSSTSLEQVTALELIKNGRIKVKELITHRFKLDKLSEAVALAMKGEKSLKIMIEP